MDKRFAVPILLLSGLGANAEPQAAEPFRVSVNVDLVVLNATVHDRKERVASDLREQDFEVYEDNVRQSLRVFRHEDVPVTVGLIIDHSGSMRAKLADVTEGARTFVKYSNLEDDMFVVNFNENVTPGLPHGVRFTSRPDELTRAVSNMPATGKTALYDAIMAGQKQLQASSRDKKVLVVISDGGDNASTHSLAEILKMAAQSSTIVYTVGIFDSEDPDRNPGVLRRLARATGGEAFFPEKLNDVVAICERIARDIRAQYTLGYVSSNPVQPGAYRNIRVTAQAAGKKLRVRTRSGYESAK